MRKVFVFRNMYLNAIMSLFSMSSAITSMTGWKASPPKLTLISHQNNGDSIDVNTNSSLHLKCSGEKPLLWSLPNNNQQYETTAEPQIKSLCDENKIPKCTTDVVISEVTFGMTGYYTCHYEGSTATENSDSLYIYVNDPNELVVPYEGSTDFMLVAVLQSHPATIPCKSTNSRAKVSLWKTSPVLKEIVANNTLGISFNPKKGYHFEYPRWDSDNSILECKIESDGNEQISQIHIHWSILPNELYPLIDDTGAKNVFLNRTFTLKCVVHIDLGVIIYMSWDVPNIKSGRVTETVPETNRIELKGNSYDTVSTNLTVTGAQKEDEGTYYCNITDVRGRVFSASKKVTVYEFGLPPAYVNFSMDIDNTKPLILKVGEMVRFVVSVESFPDFESVQLFWFKNDVLIEKNSKHYVTNVSTQKIEGTQHQAYLSILSIDMEDSGTYMLLGNTSDMSTNITMHLLVRGSPSIKMVNIVDFYEIDRPYELECVATGYPKSSIWWKWFPCQSTDNCVPSDNDSDWIDVNQNLNSSLLSNSEHLFQPDINLEYLNQISLQVIANQTGAYRCYATNDNTTIVRKQISFIVTDAINGFSILSSTDEPTVMDDITLTCKASVYNYTNLNWIRKPLEETFEDNFIEHNLTDLTEGSTKDEYSITLSIKLKSVQINDSGVYVCEAVTKDSDNERHPIDFKLDIRNISAPALIDSNMKGEVIEKTPYTQLELRCMVSGRPKPMITWYRDNKPFIVTENSGIKLEDRNQKLIFTRILDKDSGHYQCKASNRGGTVWRSARIKVDSHDDTNNTLTTDEIIVFVLFVLVGTVMIFMAIYIGKKIRQERKQKRELEFFSHNLFETGQIEMFNPDMPLDEQIELLPYDPRYEFPKERLKLGRTLGQGAFGRVVKAEAIGLEDGETSTTVAVKMLKERADINQRKALMAELKILIHLGRHLNIVNLLGAVTKNLVKGELLVIVEYCKYGNLRHYLLAYRDSYVNQLNPETGLIDPSIKTVYNPKKQSNCRNGRSPVYENVFAANGITNPNYTNMQITSIDTKKETVRYADILHNQQSGSYSNGYIASVNSNGNIETGQDSNSANGSAGYRGEGHHKRNKDRLVTTCDLLCFAFQCARGMQYLAHRKLIHRDLAARNVLLAEDNIVKICDFGLAKDVYKYDNYVKKNDGPLPIKWMAIESIRDKVFTSKSDVWSFGVLLYEFFTLGGNPYPGLEIDEEFYKRLKSGYRMERPDFAPKEVYELMNHCWNAEPKERPDFMEVADIIGALLESNVRQHYLDLNDPYQEMNEQILNNNDYLRMSSMMSSSRNEVNVDYLNMKSNGERKSDPLQHYDNLGVLRPVDGMGRLPIEPMEIVPMIQLDTYGQQFDHKGWDQTNISEDKQSDYLTMNSNNRLIGINNHNNQNNGHNNHNFTSNSSNQLCLPPPYSHVI